MCSLPSCSPASLPCCTADSGKCLYVSGIPGTGKTATVLEVMRAMKRKRCGKNTRLAPAVHAFHCCWCLGAMLCQEERCRQVPFPAPAASSPSIMPTLKIPCHPTLPPARSEAGEAPPFQFVEINGLRLPSPQHAYSALYEVRQPLPY